MSDIEWMTDAACRDIVTSLWDENVPSPEVTRYCFRCPVRSECLAYGLSRVYGSDAGILGGLGLYDRQRIRSRKSTAQQMWAMRLEELVQHAWTEALDEQFAREVSYA